MAEAYRVVRPIARVMVWNIRPAGAERLAARIGGEAVTDLANAVRQADIVSCATLSHHPLVRRLAAAGNTSRSDRRLHAGDA
jgi:ornithine cyclodeaminase